MVVLTAVDNGILIVLTVVVVVVFKAEVPFVVVVIILLEEHVVVVERIVFVLIASFLGTWLIIVMTSIMKCGVYMLLLVLSLGLLPLDLLLDRMVLNPKLLVQIGRQIGGGREAGGLYILEPEIIAVATTVQNKAVDEPY
ncbi:hypothetical protein NL676_031422 [Syzygium grande]|nr:hypothetical protein NL676_031422 [Syzygium grande]